MVNRKSRKIALRRPGSATFSTFVKITIGWWNLLRLLVEGPKKYYGYAVSSFMLEIRVSLADTDSKKVEVRTNI